MVAPSEETFTSLIEVPGSGLVVPTKRFISIGSVFDTRLVRDGEDTEFCFYWPSYRSDTHSDCLCEIS